MTLFLLEYWGQDEPKAGDICTMLIRAEDETAARRIAAELCGRTWLDDDVRSSVVPTDGKPGIVMLG